jgi:hypothetical protein
MGEAPVRSMERALKRAARRFYPNLQAGIAPTKVHFSNDRSLVDGVVAKSSHLTLSYHSKYLFNIEELPTYNSIAKSLFRQRKTVDLGRIPHL